MTDEVETSGEGEASDVRPLPPPLPAQTLQEGADARPLPKPLEGQILQKADDGEVETE